MGKKQLDNFSGQEIKEMIVNNEIKIEELNVSDLEKLLDFETDLLCLGGGDLHLIKQCTQLLETKNAIPVSKEHFENVIQQTLAENITIVEDNNSKNDKIKKRHYGRRYVKRTWIIAAAIITVMLISTVVSSAMGFDILRYLYDVVRKPVGTKIDVQEITFYNNGTAKEYASIQDVIEFENLDIIYPSKFPDAIYISRINVYDDEIGNPTIQILTNVKETYIVVETNAKSFTNDTFKDSEVYEYNNRKYHIIKDMNIAYAFYKGNSYSIRANTYEDLIFIIDNMKE